jgi:RNA polymerase sigma-70 factor (ECF subfamily)
MDDLDRIRDNALNYMYQIAVNLVRDDYRRKMARRRNDHVPFDDVPVACPMSQPDAVVESRQNVEAIERALPTLRKRERHAFHLHIDKGLNYREVADQIGVTTRTIERWMRRIRVHCHANQALMNPIIA